MLKKQMISVISILFLCCSFVHVASASPMGHHEGKDKHLHMNEEELNTLLKKGYTKEEIFRAYFISKHAEEKLDIETIIKYYKKDKSWENTAKHFGVDLEKIKRNNLEKQKQYYEKNKAKIIRNLAIYTNKKPAELETYLNEDVNLHCLVIASVIAKKSNQNLEQILKYKKEGKDFREIITTLNLDPKEVFMEVKKFHHSIQQSK